MFDNNIDLTGKTVLVTGAAGFIGAALVKRILDSESGVRVAGLDSMNDYYDPAIKEYRLEDINKSVPSEDAFVFVKGNIADKECVRKVFEEYSPSVVVNLAAQAGVRYSITNPDAYVESNVIGFYNILEACRHGNVEHLDEQGTDFIIV